MTAISLTPAYDGLSTFDDFRRSSCWDPIAECTMIMARPAAEPGLFARYHRGAVASYHRFGVSDALDSDVDSCADDTALFWVLTDVSGEVVGGVRAKGPRRGPEDSHALVEWDGHAGAAEVRAMIAERVPLGVLEMKAAWLDREPGGGRHRAKMIARSGFHAMGLFDITYCMATSAAHILDQWRSSGGVVASIPAAPYPDERYQTQMMWWDRRNFASHGDPDQVAAIVREMGQMRRGVQAERSSTLVRV